MHSLQTGYKLCRPGWSLRKEYFELVALECTFLLLRSNLPATPISFIHLHHQPPQERRQKADGRQPQADVAGWACATQTSAFFLRLDYPSMEECSEPNARVLALYCVSVFAHTAGIT
jgi:hypothetical protein